MADPVDFDGSNVNLGPPEGNEGDVRGMMVQWVPELCETVSCWRLTEEELAEIARTGVVWLSLQAPPGRCMPVYVSGVPMRAPRLDG